MLSETGGGLYFSKSDSFVIAAAIQRLSKTVLISVVEFDDMIQTSVDDGERSR